MKKSRYSYNPKTLSYEKTNKAVGKKILKSFLPKVLLSFVLAVFIFRFSGIFKLTEKYASRSETLNTMRQKYKLLNKALDQDFEILKILQHRDDNIYRMIYQSKPVSYAKRKAGYGGVDKYKVFRNYEHSDLLINACSKTDLLSNVMVVQSESYNEIFDLVKYNEKKVACIPAIQPVAMKDLTRFGSPFGYRMHPILKTGKMHTGVDLTAPTGTKIYAAGDGTVISAEYNDGGYGNLVKIDHGFGYVTYYAHMSKILTKRGSQVKRGDIIGEVGNTGRSTGPHLHYEVRINGEPKNPVNFYYKDLTDEEYERMLEESSKAQTHSFE